MMPIHELLSRIRWDKAFGDADFEIGYLDRVRHSVVRVPLKEIGFAPGDHYAFEFCDEQGEVHSVPLHRIRAVYRDGELIWHRDN